MAPHPKRLSPITPNSQEVTTLATAVYHKAKEPSIPQETRSSSKSSSSFGYKGQAEVRPKRVVMAKRQFIPTPVPVVAPPTKKRRMRKPSKPPTYTGAGVSHSKVRVLRGRYTVQMILDKKLENGKAFYLVKWKNYKSSSNTWEPYRHFSPGLIQQWEERQKQKQPTSRRGASSNPRGTRTSELNRV